MGHAPGGRPVAVTDPRPEIGLSGPLVDRAIGADDTAPVEDNQGGGGDRPGDRGRCVHGVVYQVAGMRRSRPGRPMVALDTSTE
jgi:hypothetical protein